MAQDATGIDLGTSLGYLLKEASSALRAAMEQALQPLGLSITQYSCLELLAQRPGLSSSEPGPRGVRHAAVHERAAAGDGARRARHAARRGRGRQGAARPGDPEGPAVPRAGQHGGAGGRACGCWTG
nr:hypothetical protein [Angustibacter aerolatus]